MTFPPAPPLQAASPDKPYYWNQASNTTHPAHRGRAFRSIDSARRSISVLRQRYIVIPKRFAAGHCVRANRVGSETVSGGARGGRGSQRGGYGCVRHSVVARGAVRRRCRPPNHRTHAGRAHQSERYLRVLRPGPRPGSKPLSVLRETINCSRSRLSFRRTIRHTHAVSPRGGRQRPRQCRERNGSSGDSDRRIRPRAGRRAYRDSWLRGECAHEGRRLIHFADAFVGNPES